MKLDLSPALATASYRSFRPSMGHAVRITRTAPRWVLGFPLAGTIMELAPSWREWNLRADMRTFLTAYQARMDALGADRVLGLIRSVVPLGTAVLLCYEALDGVPVKDWPYTCHRRILARYLEENTGIEVPELSPSPPGPPHGPVRPGTPSTPALDPGAPQALLLPFP